MQPATLIPESILLSGSEDFPGHSDYKISGCSNHLTEAPNRSSSGGSSQTIAAGGGIQVSSQVGVAPSPSQARSGVMLDDDVVMLSGGEDEDEDDENDIDDVTRATQTALTAATRQSGQSVGSRLLDSRSVSPTTSLNFKENAATTGAKVQTLLPDGTPIPPYMFLPDFMLNTVTRSSFWHGF